MGGKNKKRNFLESVASTAGGWVNDAVGIVSGGTVDLAKGKVSNDLGGENFQNSLQLKGTRGVTDSGSSDLPEAIDPAIQKRMADAAVQKKLDDEYGVEGSKAGLKSTLMGGSLSTDSAVLKKKKLLGE